MSNANGKFNFTGAKLSLELKNGIAIVTFNDSEKKVNILSRATMAELDCALDEIVQGVSCAEVVGVIFTSSKENVFIAGADIGEIQLAQGMSYDEVVAGSQIGKRIFKRIATLPVPTVAAVNGRALGGGLELALACDKIVAVNNKMTVFGLPETALQIVPGWGGTVRTPLKVGYFAALSLVVARPLFGMLNPRLMTWGAEKAYYAGLVDELVIAESQLRAVAMKIAAGDIAYAHKPSRLDRAMRQIGDSRTMVGAVTALMRPLKLLLGNFLPAQFAALELLTSALEDADSAFVQESHAFATLVATPACRKAVARFFAMQNKKKPS